MLELELENERDNVEESEGCVGVLDRLRRRKEIRMAWSMNEAVYVRRYLEIRRHHLSFVFLLQIFSPEFVSEERYNHGISYLQHTPPSPSLRFIVVLLVHNI